MNERYFVMMGVRVVILCLLIVQCLCLLSVVGDRLLNEMEQQQIESQIKSGIITEKEIRNGQQVIGIFSSGYRPTEYRLHVRINYEFDGERIEGSKFFSVPFEVYQLYSVGDFFDSENIEEGTTEGEKNE